MIAGLDVQRKTRSLESDAELVARCRAAPEVGEAFRRLVDRYRGMVMSCACSILRDRHEAEDVAQDTFVKAYAALASLRDPAGFCPWLMTIARNTALTRASKKAPVSMDPNARADDHRDVASSADDPATAVSRRELHALVLSELDSIPDHYRRAIYFRYLKGYSCREIAQIEGKEIGVVTSRLTRATAILREKLAKLTGERTA
jgi:RNA polymerase sigma-70 factor (ECF subfamily)